MSRVSWSARKQPKYQHLVIGLLAAIVIVTSSSPLGLMETAGVIGSAVILVVTAYQA